MQCFFGRKLHPEPAILSNMCCVGRSVRSALPGDAVFQAARLRRNTAGALVLRFAGGNPVAAELANYGIHLPSRENRRFSDLQCSPILFAQRFDFNRQ